MPASFSGKYNIKFLVSPFLFRSLLWSERIPFRTLDIWKVIPADPFCLCRTIRWSSLRVQLQDSSLQGRQKDSWIERENSWGFDLFYWERVRCALDSAHRMDHYSLTTLMSFSGSLLIWKRWGLFLYLVCVFLLNQRPSSEHRTSSEHIRGYKGRQAPVNKWHFHILTEQPIINSEEYESIHILN